MYEKQVEITAKTAFTRPAARFVKEAKSFDADITLTSNGKSASAAIQATNFRLIKVLVLFQLKIPQAQQAVDIT